MPELPEVETLRRELQQAVIGRKIESVEVFWPKMIQPLSPAELNRRLRGQKITAAGRRAKILILELTAGEKLLIHLKLTGQLIFKPKRGKPVIGGHPEDPAKYTRAVFTFTDGSKLFFNDLRKFGWMRSVDENELEKLRQQNGIEPLSREFTFEKFNALLERYPNRKIKQALMDQSLIAGLGNIYADESCFRAQVLPTRKVGSLAANEIKRLHQVIIKVLKSAIAKKGTSANTYVQLNGSPGGFVPYLKVYGRAGERCRRCGEGIIKKIKLNGRGTHYCSQCQK